MSLQEVVRNAEIKTSTVWAGSKSLQSLSLISLSSDLTSAFLVLTFGKERERERGERGGRGFQEIYSPHLTNMMLPSMRGREASLKLLKHLQFY